MQKYFIIIFTVFVGCNKRADKKVEVFEWTAPTCFENPLFCDDEEFDDLPEDGDNTGDTGD